MNTSHLKRGATALGPLVIVAILIAVVLPSVAVFQRGKLRASSKSLARAKAQYAAEAGLYCLVQELQANPNTGLVLQTEADASMPYNTRFLSKARDPKGQPFYKGGATSTGAASLELSTKGDGVLVGTFEDGTYFQAVAGLCQTPPDKDTPALAANASFYRVVARGIAKWGSESTDATEEGWMNARPGPGGKPAPHVTDAVVRVERSDALLYDDWLMTQSLASAQSHAAPAGGGQAYSGGDPISLGYTPLYGRSGIVVSTHQQASPEVHLGFVPELSTGENGVLVGPLPDQGRLRLQFSAGGKNLPDLPGYLTFFNPDAGGGALGKWEDFTTNPSAAKWVDPADRYKLAGGDATSGGDNLLRAHTFKNGRTLKMLPLATLRNALHEKADKVYTAADGGKTYRPVGYPADYQWPNAVEVAFGANGNDDPVKPKSADRPTVIYSEVPLVINGHPDRDTIIFSEQDIIINGDFNCDKAKHPELSHYRNREMLDFQGSGLEDAVKALQDGGAAAGNVWFENAAAHGRSDHAHAGEAWHSVEVISARRVWVDYSDPRRFLETAAVDYLTFELLAWLMGKVGDDPAKRGEAGWATKHWTPEALLAAYEYASAKTPPAPALGLGGNCASKLRGVTYPDFAGTIASSLAGPPGGVGPVIPPDAWIAAYAKDYRCDGVKAAELKAAGVCDAQGVHVDKLRAFVMEKVWKPLKAAGPAWYGNGTANTLSCVPYVAGTTKVPALDTAFHDAGLVSRMFRTSGRLYANRWNPGSPLTWAGSHLQYGDKFFSPLIASKYLSDAYTSGLEATERATVAGAKPAFSGVRPVATNAYFAFPWYSGPGTPRDDDLGKTFQESRLVWPEMTVVANLTDYLKMSYKGKNGVESIQRWVDPYEAGKPVKGPAVKLTGCLPPDDKDDGDPTTLKDAKLRDGLHLRCELGLSAKNDHGQAYPGNASNLNLYAFEGDLMLRMIGSELHAREYPDAAHPVPELRQYATGEANRDVVHRVTHRPPTTKRVFDPTPFLTPNPFAPMPRPPHKNVFVSIAAFNATAAASAKKSAP